MSKAILYQISEDGSKAERWELSDEPVVVGRNGRLKVSVDDEGLSRRHFLIVREGEHYVIKDLNSRNGTWVDGTRVFARKLRHDDCILAGRTRFLFTNPESLTSAGINGEAGPHGTRILHLERELETDFSTFNPWQDAPSQPRVEAAA